VELPCIGRNTSAGYHTEIQLLYKWLLYFIWAAQPDFGQAMQTVSSVAVRKKAFVVLLKTQ
jgi:hypothetical protein